MQPRKDTQLFVALNGRMCRETALPENFEPGELVAAVQEGDQETLSKAMAFVVSENAELLTPWEP